MVQYDKIRFSKPQSREITKINLTSTVPSLAPSWLPGLTDGFKSNGQRGLKTQCLSSWIWPMLRIRKIVFVHSWWLLEVYIKEEMMNQHHRGTCVMWGHGVIWHVRMGCNGCNGHPHLVVILRRTLFTMSPDVWSHSGGMGRNNLNSCP